MNGRIKEILETVEDFENPPLKADGFDEAILGYSLGHWSAKPLPFLIYDSDKIVDILMERDGMISEEATEYRVL